jgi:hypothetical protein
MHRPNFVAFAVFAFLGTSHVAVFGTEVKPIPKVMSGPDDRQTAKSCPKGFVAFGAISKIEKSKKGTVTEFVRMKNGSQQKMPAFTPTKEYDSRVGDPFCVDITSDNR